MSGNKNALESEHNLLVILKFIYSEKVTKFCKISTLLLYFVVPVKSKVEISQKFWGLLRIYELYKELKTIICIIKDSLCH